MTAGVPAEGLRFPPVPGAACTTLESTLVSGTCVISVSFFHDQT